MKRTGCAACTNGILIRGATSPLRAGDNNWQNSYLLAYNNAGLISVWREVGGTATALLGWTPSAAVVTGSSWNKLKVVAVGSSIKLYINNILVYSGSSGTWSTGKVGITFFRDSSSGNRLYVDYAKLSTTPTADPLPSADMLADPLLVGGDDRGTP
jgi:hypothetical protein